jgi:hypothetical protein
MAVILSQKSDGRSLARRVGDWNCFASLTADLPAIVPRRRVCPAFRRPPLPACIVRPDGSMVRARRHVAGLVVDDYARADLGWTYDNRMI